MLVVRHRMCLYSTYAARSRLSNIIIFLLIFNFLKNITKIIMKLNITITCKSYIYIYIYGSACCAVPTAEEIHQI